MDETVLLGSGRTATVHPWDPGRVVKLFRPGYPRAAVDHEHACADAVRPHALPTPAAHGVVRHGERWGIVYDRVDGETLEAWALRTGDVAACAAVLADVHRAVGAVRAGPGLPSYKDVLRAHLRAADLLPQADRSAALTLLDALDDGPWLCHGDLHPGNVLLAVTGPHVVDLTNLCRGPLLYDVARTVHLVQETPVPPDAPDAHALRTLKDAVAEAFLQASGVTRAAVAPYLAVIRAARVGECPDLPRVT